MTLKQIQEAVRQVAPFYPVFSVDLFGSYARQEAGDNSDIDLLVNFDGRVASLFDLSGMKFDIQDRLQKKVDIVAGPLKSDSHLMIDKTVRLYELFMAMVN